MRKGTEKMKMQRLRKPRRIMICVKAMRGSRSTDHESGMRRHRVAKRSKAVPWVSAERGKEL